eukprot:CAMPEP_0116857980 /NCGR_PEP_ID=MMETSP0418-20121206/20878_1 /TAXON_ID=1158023 /ORGANISM="Astrosyne radiata, Strain 13vi08-1A" /LENGTH=261 /DNA_ID=CAMNT_0004491771 /DNA_START=375 /DNA_END=1156 /DNA_ORIENTATION=-
MPETPPESDDDENKRKNNDLDKTRLELLSDIAILKKEVDARGQLLPSATRAHWRRPPTSEATTPPTRRNVAPSLAGPMPLGPRPKLPTCGPLDPMTATGTWPQSGTQYPTATSNTASMTASEAQHPSTNPITASTARQASLSPAAAFPSAPGTTQAKTKSPLPSSAPLSPPDESAPPIYHSLMDENHRLKSDLGEAKREIARLRLEVEQAKDGMMEMRSLPAAKISQIPISDMLELMAEYGSETTNQHYQAPKGNRKPPQP